MARLTMPAMHRDGRITLPPPGQRAGRQGPVIFGPDTGPTPLPASPATLEAMQPPGVSIVTGGTREGKPWNGFVARYHHPGYTTLVGTRMRHAFIGCNAGMRRKNLPPVVDNPRFLILPRIRIPDPDPRILAIMRRRLPADRSRRCNITPLLIETFVRPPRFTGGVCKASGWIHAGVTQGRGRHDIHRRRDKPKKDIRPRPLRKGWRRWLNRM